LKSRLAGLFDGFIAGPERPAMKFGGPGRALGLRPCPDGMAGFLTVF
jgi:hypothetical protein